MKEINDYINEKANFLVKKHVKPQIKIEFDSKKVADMKCYDGSVIWGDKKKEVINKFIKMSCGIPEINKKFEDEIFIFVTEYFTMFIETKFTDYTMNLLMSGGINNINANDVIDNIKSSERVIDDNLYKWAWPDTFNFFLIGLSKLVQ